MNMSSAFPRLGRPAKQGIIKMGRAKLTIFPKDKGNSPGSSASQWNPPPPWYLPYITGIHLIEETFHLSLRIWLNLSRATVNKDHKILNSLLHFFWSLNNVPTGRETKPPRCFPQDSSGWPGVLPQGKPSLAATETLNFYHNYSVKPRQCLFVVFHVGPDTWWTTVLV